MNEVFTNIYQNMSGASRNLVEPTLRFGQLAARMQEQLVRQQIAVFETCMGVGCKQLQAIGEVKDPQGFYSRQAELAAELGEKLIVATQQALELQVQARDEMGELVKEGFKAIEPRSSKTTAKAEKKAA